MKLKFEIYIFFKISVFNTLIKLIIFLFINNSKPGG